MDIKSGFLILACCMVSAIALLYGVDPRWFAGTFLGTGDVGVDLAHILRAVMCLYLALGAFWLSCALSGRHKDAAILTTMVFAGGLLAGRVLSFAVDGLPSPLLSVYALLELSVLPLAWWVYTRPG